MDHCPQTRRNFFLGIVLSGVLAVQATQAVRACRNVRRRHLHQSRTPEHRVEAPPDGRLGATGSLGYGAEFGARLTDNLSVFAGGDHPGSI